MAGTLARRSTMEKLVIEGGVPLSGTIVPAGNKNAALPLLAASLLTEERVVIANVPRIRDTEAMLALLADLGVTVEWIEDNTVSLQADAVADTDVDPDLAERIRASFLVAGPLLTGLDPTRNAYPAIVWVLVLWTLTHVAVGMLMHTYCLLRRVAGRLTARHDIDLRNVTLYWHFTALTVAMTVLVIAGFPQVR